MSEISELRDAINRLKDAVLKSHSNATSTPSIAGGAAIASASMTSSTLAQSSEKIHGILYLVANDFSRAVTLMVASVQRITKAMSMSSPTTGGTSPVSSAVFGLDKSLKAVLKARHDEDMSGQYSRYAKGSGDNPPKQNDWQSFWNNPRVVSSLERLNSAAGKAALTLTGMATLGLQGTVEGNQLSRAFGNLAFQIADLLRGPIRMLISELNGMARIAKAINNSNIGPAVGDGLGAGIAALTLNKLGIGSGIALGIEKAAPIIGRTMGTAMGAATRLAPGLLPAVGAGLIGNGIMGEVNQSRQEAEHRMMLKSGMSEEEAAAEADRRAHPTRDLWNWMKGSKEREGNIFGSGYKPPEAKKPEEAKKEPPIRPIYQTAFGGLTSLWENLQSKVTENPMIHNQEKGLTIMERIYNALAFLVDKAGGDLKPIGEHDLFGGT